MNYCENHGEEVMIRDFRANQVTDAQCVPCKEIVAVYPIFYEMTDRGTYRRVKEENHEWAV